MSLVFPLPLSLLKQQDRLADEILSQMERILANEVFARSPRLRQLFRFAVETSVEGKAHSLKEYTIAVDVFKRSESFDCRLDSIVRVEAARLRKKLDHFYETAGVEDEIILRLPAAGYEPVVSFRDDRGPSHSGATVVALVAGKDRPPAAWTRTFEGGSAKMIHISRESLETFDGRYDLVVVFVGQSEKPSDYGWIVDATARRTSALLFVSDPHCEASLLQITKALQAAASEGTGSTSLQHSRWSTRKPGGQAIPITSVA